MYGGKFRYKVSPKLGEMHKLKEEFREVSNAKFTFKDPCNSPSAAELITELPPIHIYYNNQNPYPSMDIALNIS